MAEAHLHSACCNLIGDVARLSGQARLRVTGASMLPALVPGDVITVRHPASGELQAGDVVLYRRNNGLTAHRIVRIAKGYVVTRGDSVPSLDPPVPLDEVIGRVASLSRNGQAADCRRSFGRSAAAWLFRRSQLCTRIFLRLRSDPGSWAPEPTRVR